MPDVSNREKRVLIFGILFLVLFFGIRLGISPVFEKRQNYQRILKEKQTALAEMMALEKQFQAVSIDFDTTTRALADRQEGFSLFSFLDLRAQESGLKNNVAYMTPFSKKIEKTDYAIDTVKFKLTQIHLRDLADFLYQIESSENKVTITALLLTKTGKNNELLDAVIEAETLMLKEQG